MADLKLTTPDEYISYYFNQLQQDLNVYDIQANKFGFLGYFLNILGHTNFDTKQYYDSLFKESFVATAQEDKNLFVHAGTYGYIPGFCTPSIAVGNFIFDFADLPKKPDNVVKREVYFGTDTSLVQFDVDGYTFTSTARYKFIEENNQFKCIVFTNDGKIIDVPSSSSRIVVPMYGVYQYSIEEVTIPELDSYPFGSFTTTQFEIKQPYITDLEVFIKKPTDTDFQQYALRRVKYFEQPFSKVVFFRKISDTKFELEFGSGVRGEWVTNATVKINAKYTYGEKGNLNKNTKTVTRDSNTLSYQSTMMSHVYSVNYSYINGNLTASTETYFDPKYVLVDFQYSENGTIPNEGENLRQEIVKFIQTRDNMINQRDFYNITEQYLNDFKFLFKKSHVMDNTFHLCRTFRNRYQQVIPSINKSVKVIDVNIPPVAPVATIKTGTSTLAPGTYYYKIVACNRFSTTTSSSEVAVTVTDPNSVIKLSWPKHTGAECYKIFGRTQNSQTLYWETYDTFFTDNGSDTNAKTGIPGTGVVNNEIWWPRFRYDLDNVFSLVTSDYRWMPSANGTGEFYLQLNQGGNPQLIKPSHVLEAGLEIFEGDIGSLQQSQWAYGDNDNIGYNTLYVRTLADLAPSVYDENYLKVNLINSKEFISPFLYKYNDLMTWYDAYVVFKFMLVNFNTFTLKEQYYTPPSLYLNLDYDFENKKTTIYLKSYQLISDLTFTITIEDLSLYDIVMTPVDDNTFKYEYTLDTGRFEIPIQARIKATKDNKDKFEVLTDKILQVKSISDQLRLLSFVQADGKWILTIPSIESATFDYEQQYYLQKLYDFVVGFSFRENRMQTDNVQFRFMNTHAVDTEYLELVTRQKYNTYNMIFPLKMQIEVLADQTYVTKNNINLSDVREQILTDVSSYLQFTSTGYNLKYYNSQIEDIIHSIGSYILSVKVTVRDSSIHQNVITSGIELLEEIDLMESLRPYKLRLVKYTPHFFNWDVDNIDLRIEF
jgi:hypothetical protein